MNDLDHALESKASHHLSPVSMPSIAGPIASDHERNAGCASCGQRGSRAGRSETRRRYRRLRAQEEKHTRAFRPNAGPCRASLIAPHHFFSAGTGEGSTSLTNPAATCLWSDSVSRPDTIHRERLPNLSNQSAVRFVPATPAAGVAMIESGELRALMDAPMDRIVTAGGRFALLAKGDGCTIAPAD